ncbi:MAG: protein kinase domain-containing protein, partial [Planctomycetaceae bacterium]
LPGQAAGTLRYMSPEQSDGHATTLSDVYSLGVTLYEMLALKPAFTSHSTRSLQQQITAGSCPSLHSHDPGIPRDLAVITQKAMALRPQDRYQSAAALAEDLQRFIDGRPILARPMSAPEQLWRLIARHKLVSAISALATILLVATSAIAIYSEVLRINGLESEIGKLVSEANSTANSGIPGQRTEGITKLRQAEELAAQSYRKADLIQLIRDNAAAVVSAPELLVSEPVHERVSLNAFVISRNERRVVVAAEENFLDVHDRSGTKLAQIPFEKKVDKFELSADGSRLVVSTAAPELTCWDLTAAKPVLLWKIPQSQASAFTFLPDEKQVAAADPDGSILLLDLQSGRLLQKFACTGPTAQIQLRPHPTEPIIAVTSNNYHEVCFLNLQSGTVENQIPRFGVSGFDWHPDGQSLAVHDELLEIELLHWPSLKKKKTFYKGIGPTHCKFSPDGRWLAFSTWSPGGSQHQLVTIRIEDELTLTCPWPYIPDGKAQSWYDPSSQPQTLQPAALWNGNRVVRVQLNDPRVQQTFDKTNPRLTVAPHLVPSD